MRAGDTTGYNQIASMYAIEHAIKKVDYTQMLKEAVSK